MIEDFGAPFSSVAVPWMTARPVLGVVQWLFAHEKSKQYHLPFSVVERLGVRSHRRMIAVSDDLGAELAERNPRAEVTVVANGLDEGAFDSYDRTRSGIAYLGRLETAQKGLDLLLEAFAQVADRIEQNLIIGGDGPDRDDLVALADRMGIGDRVRFVGRIAAADRFDWLAGADLVAMPSRYETFGMVAAEALAVATPVVAFDIPCLRALVDEDVGRRVPAFEVEAFAAALTALAHDVELRRRLGDAGPARVASLNWDDLAAEQGQVYRRLLERDEDLIPPADRARTVVGLFAAQQEVTPDRVAVADRDTEWTYADLGRAAAEITKELQACGIGSGERVGVCLPRSKEAVAAMLGVWGARATYVPLDPEYPSARLRAMCERVGLSVVIGAPGGSHRLGASFTVLDPSAILGSADAPATDGDHLVEPASEAAAYILFTSGSSGRPKAVEVAHESLTSVLEWVHATFSPDELAVTTTSISFSFDPFVLEVLGPLTVGGTVRVIPSALAIADLEPGVTLLANTPSVLSELWRAGRLPSTLKTIISGGEILSASLASGLLRDSSVSRLVNTYGPTEATVLATAHEVELPVGEPVPIGRPLPGAGVVLLDDESEEVPCGTIGEICIFGPQVAVGYVGDAEETALRFVEWTSDTGTRTRMYRTGISVGATRTASSGSAGGRTASSSSAATASSPARSRPRWCAIPTSTRRSSPVSETVRARSWSRYATGAAPALSSVDLHAWLQQSLPPYLVPSHVLVVDAFPVNANGKVAIDRLPPGLPARIAHDRPAPPPTEGPDPARSRTATVARLAAAILGDQGPIGADDDFLEDLGGSSLALFQLLTAIEEEFSCRIEIGRILEDTTIRGLAALVGADSDDPRYLSVHEEGRLHPIYMIHAYLGTALRYRRLGRYLSSERPLVGIQVQAFDDPTSAARTSIEQMAEEAAAQIRALRPEGPYLLRRPLGRRSGGVRSSPAAGKRRRNRAARRVARQPGSTVAGPLPLCRSGGELAGHPLRRRGGATETAAVGDREPLEPVPTEPRGGPCGCRHHQLVPRATSR